MWSTLSTQTSRQDQCLSQFGLCQGRTQIFGSALHGVHPSVLRDFLKKSAQALAANLVPWRAHIMIMALPSSSPHSSPAAANQILSPVGAFRCAPNVSQADTSKLFSPASKKAMWTDSLETTNKQVIDLGSSTCNLSTVQRHFPGEGPIWFCIKDHVTLNLGVTNQTFLLIASCLLRWHMSLRWVFTRFAGHFHCLHLLLKCVTPQVISLPCICGKGFLHCLWQFSPMFASLFPKSQFDFFQTIASCVLKTCRHHQENAGLLRRQCAFAHSETLTGWHSLRSLSGIQS